MRNWLFGLVAGIGLSVVVSSVLSHKPAMADVETAEGDEPFTPTKRVWLLTQLNLSYSMFKVPGHVACGAGPKRNDIAITWNYPAGMDESLIERWRKAILESAEQDKSWYGFKWANIIFTAIPKPN